MGYKSEQELDSMTQAQVTRFVADTLPLGTHPTLKQAFYITEKDRCGGMGINGITGKGKSGLAENIFHLSAITGKCTIFVAPDDNSIRKCIARLPEDLLHKVYLLNMEDIEFPFTLNILGNVNPADEIELTKAVNRVMHIFETQWDVMGQVGLPRYLRNGTIALLHNKGCTLPDMLRFLTDDQFRHAKLRAVKDQTLLDFWERFDEMTVSARNQKIEPLIVRLETLFTARSMMRNLLGQPQSSVNLRHTIQDGYILFVVLPVKVLRAEAKLVGAVFIGLLHNAIFSFSDTPEYARPGLSLIIDEWANYCSSDIAELINEGRKFGLQLTCIQQYLSQLPEPLQKAFMAMHTKIFFQSTIDDSQKAAHLFPNIETTLKPEDMERNIVGHLLNNGSRNPDVTTFIETYLRPVRNASRKNGKLEIKNQIAWWELWINAFLHVPPPANPTVSDPLPDLNDFLYKAMLAGRLPERVSSGIVEGFTGCGRGFYQAFKWGLKDRLLIFKNIYTPAEWTENTPNGDVRWVKKPARGKPQLYHFLWHLMMTVEELTRCPIGKQTKSTVSTAQQIMSLPFRHAYVKSGDEAGVIVTDDTFDQVSEQELQMRLQRITAQTRSKFCKPKSELEKDHKQQPDDDDDKPYSRSEVI